MALQGSLVGEGTLGASRGYAAIRRLAASRARPWLVWLGLSFIALLAFVPAMSSGFQEDDYTILWSIQKGGPFGMWSQASAQFFRPLVSLTFWFQYQMAGLDSGSFRLLNIGLHAGVAFALYLFLFEALRGSKHKQPIALGSSLLFLLHPSRAETVNWIASRADLLGALFALLALYFFVRLAKTRNKIDLILSLSCFGLGVLSNESVLLTPLIAVFYVCTMVHGPDRGRMLLQGVLGFSAVVALYVGLRIGVMGTGLQWLLSGRSGLSILAGTTAIQLVRMVLPGLPVGDPFLANGVVLKTMPAVIYLGLGILLVGAPVILGWPRSLQKRSPEWRLAPFILAGLIMAWIPSLGLAVRLFRSQGERFLYFPSIFLITLLVIFVCLWLHRPRIRNVVLCAAAVLCFCGLQAQNAIWTKGADVADRVASSYVDHVAKKLPKGTPGVVLLNAPARLIGSYGLAGAFRGAAEVRGVKSPPGRTAAAMTLRNPEGKVRLEIVGNRLKLISDARYGQFIKEDSMNRGILSFKPQVVSLDLAALPAKAAVFFWDGSRFRAVRVRKQ